METLKSNPKTANVLKGGGVAMVVDLLNFTAKCMSTRGRHQQELQPHLQQTKQIKKCYFYQFQPKSIAFVFSHPLLLSDIFWLCSAFSDCFLHASRVFFHFSCFFWLRSKIVNLNTLTRNFKPISFCFFWRLRMEAGPHMGFRGQMRLNCPFLFSPPKLNPTSILRGYVPDIFCHVKCINRGALFRNSCINVWHCMATFPPKKNGDIVRMEV